MRRLRRWGTRAVGAFLGGVLLVGVAWAGAGTAPVAQRAEPVRAASAQALEALEVLQADTVPAAPFRPPDIRRLPALPEGEFLVGTSVRSLEPNARQWQRRDCSELLSRAEEDIVHLGDRILSEQKIPPGWPKTPDCVYLGGYGIGPSRAATAVDTYAGAYVRTVAISNGRRTIVWQMIDAVGYYSKYRDDLCADCGILDMRRTIAGGLRISPNNIAIGSTHTHGGFDGYGVFGGIPDWYRHQVRDRVISGAYSAVRAMVPARIEIGSVEARAFNSERRNTYRSVPDYGAVWMQARRLSAAGDQPAGGVVATLVNFGAHPTVLGAQPVMHGDWPGTASKSLGDRFGGEGLVFVGGLGNVSPSRPLNATVDFTGDGRIDNYDHVAQMGYDFADFMARAMAKGGLVLQDNTIAAASTVVEHPVTNALLAGAGVSGLADRQFTPGDGAGLGGTWAGGKSELRPCATAGPLSIKTEVSAYRVGDLSVVTGPGELFSGMTQIVKSRARRNAFTGGQTMVFAQTQDSLGYIIQSVEADPLGGVLTNLEGALAEYEETFMVDRCFGDHVLEAQLDLVSSLP